MNTDIFMLMVALKHGSGLAVTMKTNTKQACFFFTLWGPRQLAVHTDGERLITVLVVSTKDIDEDFLVDKDFIQTKKVS